MPTPCPTPTKARYATAEAAANAARRRVLVLEQLLRPYECACTWFHLTKSDNNPMPDHACPAPADVNRLRHMPDAEFLAAVKADVQGRLDLPDRIALRHPKLLGRWARALEQLRVDLDQQLAWRAADRAAEDWRRRVALYEFGVEQRTDECRRLRDARHPLKEAA